MQYRFILMQGKVFGMLGFIFDQKNVNYQLVSSY
jgi:hypothetical protein